MIVEDEYFIASDVSRALRREGADVIGPSPSLEHGLELADGPLDAAVLDVNLSGDGSLPIARRLIQRAVPFILLTGYDDWALPDDYRTVPRLTKPVPPHRVVDAVERLIIPSEAA